MLNRRLTESAWPKVEQVAPIESWLSRLKLVSNKCLPMSTLNKDQP